MELWLKNLTANLIFPKSGVIIKSGKEQKFITLTYTP